MKCPLELPEPNVSFSQPFHSATYLPSIKDSNSFEISSIKKTLLGYSYMISPLGALFLSILWANRIWNRLKWLSSRTRVSMFTYLFGPPNFKALLQSSIERKKGKKKVNDSILLYLKLFLLPTDTFLKAPVMDEELHWGQSWIPLDCLGHVGEAAETQCSQNLSFVIHGSPPWAAGHAQICHRRKQTVSLERQGGNQRHVWDD